MNLALRSLAWTLAICMIALPLIAVLNGWIGNERWPMRRLAVTADFEMVSEQAVRDAVQPYVGKGFFAVELSKVRAAVAKIAWVDQIEVRKRWPDRLEIVLTEHAPIAHWGDKQMVSESGQFYLAPPVTVPSMPTFEGPQDRIHELIEFYIYSSSQFALSGRDVKVVRLSIRGGWSLSLDNGLEIEVGRDNKNERVRRFAKSLPKISAAAGLKIVRADLRYTNGFAIAWGQAADIQTTTGQKVQKSS